MKAYKNTKSTSDKISEIQHKLYQGIILRQQQLDKQTELMKQKYDCEVNRAQSISNSNLREQVLHPYNDTIGDQGRWRYIGYCADQLNNINLDDIRERQQRRIQLKDQIVVSRNQRERKQKNIAWNKNENQEIGERKGRRKEQNQQIPWQLMRKLREHDVQENKKRIEEVQKYQIATSKQYHK